MRHIANPSDLKPQGIQLLPHGGFFHEYDMTENQNLVR